jgi:hypothetical protein
MHFLPPRDRDGPVAARPALGLHQEPMDPREPNRCPIAEAKTHSPSQSGSPLLIGTQRAQADPLGRLHLDNPSGKPARLEEIVWHGMQHHVGSEGRELAPLDAGNHVCSAGLWVQGDLGLGTPRPVGTPLPDAGTLHTLPVGQTRAHTRA